MKLENTIGNLLEFIQKEEFKGWDPYDGLNSKIANKLGLLKIPIFRLILIQAFKNNPINLRTLFMVPKGYNPKGLALCLNAICNLYNCPESVLKSFNLSKDICFELINQLSEKLISLSSKGYAGSCWGYNFDWQARLLFLFPKGTPNVVCTAYAVEALMNAYEISGKQLFLDHALSSGDFIINNLNRTYTNDGHIFSYSPLDGNNTVFNASLLGAKTLSHCYKYNNKNKYRKVALSAINACLKIQNENGSWYYGGLDVQKWIDSYHTAYNLEAINACKKVFKTNKFDLSLEKGFNFYINNFFLEDGTPKYYHNKVHPIDIHSPAQFLVLLCSLDKLDHYNDLIKKVLNWTNKNMLSDKGYYFYQKHRFYTVRIPYFRWSQAFMLNALSFYLRKLNDN